MDIPAISNRAASLTAGTNRTAPTGELASARLEFPDTTVEVYSGPGALRLVPDLLEYLGIARPFLICGQHVRRLPQVVDLVDTGLFAGAYEEVEPDPSHTTVAQAGEQVRQVKADGLVAIGGGSSMDVGKAAAAEAVSPGWVADCERPGQPLEVPEGRLPVLAVPTTAGTGSEVTAFCVITLRGAQRKLALNHPYLLPRAAVLDPTLLTTVPRTVRVATGMDALTHAVESYVSKQATEMTRSRSLAAAAGVGAHLPEAAANPPASAALAGMQHAALLAGLAFSRTRLGVVHALALPLSAFFGVPHGAANAILLPHGMTFNLPAAAPWYGNLAHALTVKASGADAEGLPEQAVGRVQELARRIGAPLRMRDVGVDRAALPRMAAEAFRSPHLAVNPRPVEKADLIAIYEAAW